MEGLYVPLNMKLQKILDSYNQRKYYLDKNYLKHIYFAHMHAYLNYANIAWTSTHKIKRSK